MTKRIALLAALVGMAGPAFAQVAPSGLESLANLEQGTWMAGSPQHDPSSADCDGYFRSARARNDLPPSQRRAARAACRAAAAAERQRLAGGHGGAEGYHQLLIKRHDDQ
jgi:hypothetical protein